MTADFETDQKTWGRDAIERVIVTAVEAFLATLIAAHALDVAAFQEASNAAAVAGIATLGALVKSIAARYIGNPESASLAD